MLTLMKRLVREESGQGLAEYGLIIALVAILVIGALTIFREALEDVFERIADAINT